MQYRILKLRSGEEIITRITGKQKGKMTLERPMVFRVMMMHDGLGRPREVTVLRNWTPNTNDLHTKIPEDHIATFMNPSDEAVKLYELEKDQEDRVDSTVVGHPIKPPNNPDMMSMLDSLIRLKEDLEDMDLDDEKEDLLNSLEPSDDDLDIIDDEDKDELMNDDMMNMITMTMFFPPELLSKMMNEGLIDPTHIGKILGEVNKSSGDDKFSPISDIYTGDQDEREDMGSWWTDWSSNPEDYFKDDNHNDNDNPKDKEEEDNP